MTPFYTRTGDDGYTGLLGEGRIPKYHPQAELVGAVDEASAALGLARSSCAGEDTTNIVLAIQRDLYHLMAEISASPDNVLRFRQIDSQKVTWLEQQIDALSERVALPHEFILPGDTAAGAAFAVARTTVRRAERRLALLVHEGVVQNSDLLRYLNRLSSLCFILELYEDQLAGKGQPNLAK